MPRIFAYARVSTMHQETDSQIKEIESAGFAIEPHRVMTETISGSMAISSAQGLWTSIRQNGKRRCFDRH